MTLLDVDENEPMLLRLTTNSRPSFPPPMISNGVFDELSGISTGEQPARSASFAARNEASSGVKKSCTDKSSAESHRNESLYPPSGSYWSSPVVMHTCP